MATNWVDYVPGQGYAAMPWAGDIFSPWRDPVLQWLRQQGYQQVANGGSVGSVALQLQRPIRRG